MRAVVLLTLAACGRVSFDARTQDDDTSDGPSGPTRFYVTSGDETKVSRLYELVPETGELTDLGSLGVTYPLGGLAAWDDNTLYATGETSLHRITLSPLSVTVVRDVGGAISALERDGNDLIGVDQDGSQLVRMPEPSFAPTRLALNVVASGGDLVQLSTGEWRWWSSTTNKLYSLDPVTARAVPIGSTKIGFPFVSGVTRTDDDRLLITASADNTLTEMDATTGEIVDTRTLCSPCPTEFDLLSGDSTRSR